MAQFAAGLKAVNGLPIVNDEGGNFFCEIVR